MTTGMLGTAITGLKAFQRSLETTSHNIANVNTEGYSRQRVDLVTSKEQMISVGYLGTGVNISNITRSYDQFITTQLRSSTSTFGDVDKYSQLASQVDDILADPTVGMAPAIKDFFSAVNDAADDPSSIPARQVLISESKIITGRFDTMSSRFGQIREQVNQDMVVMADQITSLASSVADLNKRISSEQGQPNAEQQPNDLLDKRDTVLNQLAELINISVVPSSRNMVTVFMGQGHVLVIDDIANKIVTQPSEFDFSTLEVGVKGKTTGVEVISDVVTGGALAGTLRFREEVLEPAQQRLGSVAASIALEFNKLHEQNGYDLDGIAGETFFAGFDSIDTLVNEENTGTMTLTVTFDKNNINSIDYSDFVLENTGVGSYRLIRKVDDTVINLQDDGSGTALVPVSATDKLPGISIGYAGVANVEDSFLIRPTYNAASKIEANIIDPRKVALATNMATDSQGVDYIINGPMPGDNRNALALAKLENGLGMFNGTASFQDAYGLVVSEVGVLTSAAQISVAAQETLYNNAKEAWSNVSGVNLDEEAANLIKFQQSYQAAAQVISVSSNLFDTLLGAVN